MKNFNGYEIISTKEVDCLLDNYKDELYAPAKKDIFKALELTSLKEVKVVILGQDPYPIYGDATGLSFSVNREEKLPKSLLNIFKELESEYGTLRTNGDLSDWSKQGVLLLNTVLTVEIGNANSHKNLGWQFTTNHIIDQINNLEGIIFVLLGKQAQQYKCMINTTKHIVLETSHPSPLSSYRGFLGSDIFKKINIALIKQEKEPIKWYNN